MDTLKQLKEELTEEYQTTKKFFELFPDGKNGYAPHPKSMKLMPLAQHVAEVFGWADIVLKTDSIDFASGDRPQPFSNRQELLDALEKNHAISIEALSKADEADLLPLWSVTYNGHKVGEWTKYGAIRHSLNQATHHRAQLGVYYRLNDIKVPGSYGPSADEM